MESQDKKENKQNQPKAQSRDYYERAGRIEAEFKKIQQDVEKQYEEYVDSVFNGEERPVQTEELEKNALERKLAVLREKARNEAKKEEGMAPAPLDPLSADLSVINEEYAKKINDFLDRGVFNSETVTDLEKTLADAERRRAPLVKQLKAAEDARREKEAQTEEYHLRAERISEEFAVIEADLAAEMEKHVDAILNGSEIPGHDDELVREEIRKKMKVLEREAKVKVDAEAGAAAVAGKQAKGPLEAKINEMNRERDAYVHAFLAHPEGWEGELSQLEKLLEKQRNEKKELKEKLQKEKEEIEAKEKAEKQAELEAEKQAETEARMKSEAQAQAQAEAEAQQNQEAQAEEHAPEAVNPENENAEPVNDEEGAPLADSAENNVKIEFVTPRPYYPENGETPKDEAAPENRQPENAATPENEPIPEKKEAPENEPAPEKKDASKNRPAGNEQKENPFREDDVVLAVPGYRTPKFEDEKGENKDRAPEKENAGRENQPLRPEAQDVPGEDKAEAQKDAEAVRPPVFVTQIPIENDPENPREPEEPEMNQKEEPVIEPEEDPQAEQPIPFPVTREPNAQASFDGAKKAVSDAMNRAFSSAEKSDIFRTNYIFVDGKPLSGYQAELNMDDSDARYTEMSGALILSALVSGRRVTYAELDPKTGRFDPEKIKEFPLPADAAEALEIPEIADEFRQKATEVTLPPTDGSPEGIQRNFDYAKQYLVKKSATEEIKSLNNNDYYVKSDLLRTVKQTLDAANKKDNDLQDILVDVNKKMPEISLARFSFTTHALGYMVVRGDDPDVIFDQEKGKDLRASAGNTLYNLVNNQNLEEVISVNLDASERICDILDEKLAQIDFSKDDVLYSPEVITLAKLAHVSFDLQQERDTNKELAYSVMAKKKGLDLQKPADRKQIEAQYEKLMDRCIVLSNLTTMLNQRNHGLDAALGKVSPETFSDDRLGDVLSSDFARNLIVRAQRNGEPFSLSADMNLIGNLVQCGNSLENGKDPATRNLFLSLKNVNTVEETKAKAAELLSGDFYESHHFREISDGPRSVSMTIAPKEPALSSPFDHPAASRDFYTARFVRPTDAPAENADDGAKLALDRAISQALVKQFRIRQNEPDSAAGRLFYADAANGNRLVPVDLREDPDRLPDRLREYALTNRLFAVPENEQAPVQLQTARNNGKWTVTAADCLDAPAHPVNYRWYHKIGAFFGNTACKNLRDQYMTEQLRTAMRNDIQAIKEQRAPFTTFEAISARETERRTKAMTEALEKASQPVKDYPNAVRSVSEIYGPNPVYRKDCEEISCYTKEQFDSLKKIGLELTDKEKPVRSSDGKLLFREKDFIGLAMSAAASPDLAGVMRQGYEDSKRIDPKLAADSVSSMYLDDFLLNRSEDGEHFFPRQDIGRYIENTVAPARERAAEAIREYRDGDSDKLAQLIANGLAFYSRVLNQSSASVAPAVIQEQFAALSDVVEADPLLRVAVEKKAEIMRENAKDQLRNTENAHRRFLTENETYLTESEKKLRELNEAAKKIPTDDAHKEESANAFRKIHEYLEADDQKFIAVCEKKAMFTGQEAYYKAMTEFNPETTMKRMAEDRQIHAILEKGKKAETELTRASITKKILTKEQKASYMKDIFHAELVACTEKGLEEKLDAGPNAVIAESKILNDLGKGDYLFDRRSTDPELALQEARMTQASQSVSTCVSNVLLCTNRMNHFSKATETILDPKKLDVVYDKIIPDHDKFAAMNCEVLTGSKNLIKREIADYLGKVELPKKEENAVPDLNLIGNEPREESEEKEIEEIRI